MTEECFVRGITSTGNANNDPADGWMDLPDSTRKKGKLTIIPMRGWKRNMLWTETGLRWIPTSPYIPDLSAVLGYAMTGLGAQEGDFTHGIGTPYPFRLLQYKGKSPIEVKAALRAKNIPGLSYEIIQTHTTLSLIHISEPTRP